mgnify:CR=1 FL=1|jgi:hypothetical protein
MAETQVVEAEEVKPSPDPIKDVKSRVKKAFLVAYIDSGGNISKTAESLNINKSKHYYWLKTDKVYAQAFEVAHERSLATIESEIIRRAVEGYEEPVFYQGKQVSAVRKYSDNLLMFLAKRRDPNYRDNNQTQIGIWGADGSQVAVNFSIPRPERKKVEKK